MDIMQNTALRGRFGAGINPAGLFWFALLTLATVPLMPVAGQRSMLRQPLRQVLELAPDHTHHHQVRRSQQSVGRHRSVLRRQRT